MKWHPVAHGSPEWIALRVGRATASAFDKIITPKTLKLSSQADKYANQVIAEKILGEAQDGFVKTYWMERGAVMEAEARAMYEFVSGYTCDRGGIFISESDLLGASPDVRVVDKDGIVRGGAEIKCPSPAVHVENLLLDKIDADYMPQIQGQILVCGFEFVDFFSFHPEMPPAYIRTYRDNDYCDALADALEKFEKILSQKIEVLLEKGVIFPEPKAKPETPSPVDYMSAG